jgi:hypothetical protein
MGNIRQSKPKEANIKKLEIYLKKIENGKQKNTRPNSQGKRDSK